MTVLLLRLAGPMQSWGVDSRFSRRETLRHPTKSGVLGLLAAAKGLRRTDPLQDLLGLTFGVRVDQPGVLMNDFHTAHNWRTGASMPLSNRHYLADAVFVAAVEGDASLLETLDAAIHRPKFPLFLGRRSCPVSGRISLGLRSGKLVDELAECEWQAAHWYRRRQDAAVRLPIYLDAEQVPGTPSIATPDDPVSFDPRRRVHGWRNVGQTDVVKTNPDAKGFEGGSGGADDIDFFAAVGGA
jgi:CRISPR system Cascade subunit CasD